MSNNRASKYERQKTTELQGEIDISIVIGGDLIDLEVGTQGSSFQIAFICSV